MSEQPIVEYLTQEAFDRLQAELEQRRTTGRTEVTAKIEVARAHGDLRENAEYHAAKEEQGQNEARIRVLEEKLRTAIVGTPPQAAEGKVTAGMVLEVEEDGDVSAIYLGSREDQPKPASWWCPPPRRWASRWSAPRSATRSPTPRRAARSRSRSGRRSCWAPDAERGAMCRIAAHVGPPATLASLLYDAPRSLQEVAIAPREQQQGRVNVDGTGVAWWDGTDPRPLSYRTVQPPWADANLPGLARRLQGEVVLAAVRSASPGMPIGVTATHPFVVDGVAGTHNGRIDGFREHVAAPLLARLGTAWTGRLEIVTDASVLVMLAAAAIADGATPGRRGADRGRGRRRRVRRDRPVGDADARPRDGRRAWSRSTARTTTPANSLYVAQRGAASWLASEPLDDAGGWIPVPHGATAVLRRDAPPTVHPAGADTGV